MQSTALDPVRNGKVPWAQSLLSAIYSSPRKVNHIKLKKKKVQKAYVEAQVVKYLDAGHKMQECTSQQSTSDPGAEY